MNRLSASNNNDEDHRENTNIYINQHNRNISLDTIKSLVTSSHSNDSNNNGEKGKEGSDSGKPAYKEVPTKRATENTPVRRIKSELGKFGISINLHNQEEKTKEPEVNRVESETVQNREEKEQLEELEDKKTELNKQEQQTESDNKDSEREKRIAVIFDNKAKESLKLLYINDNRTTDTKTKLTPTPPTVLTNLPPPASLSSSSSSGKIINKIIKAMLCCCCLSPIILIFDKIKKIFKRSKKGENKQGTNDDGESGGRNNKKKKKNRNCCLIIMLVIVILLLLGNLIILDVAMVNNTSAANSNITQVISPSNNTSDPVEKQLESKIRSVVCMSMLAGLPPKQFPCDFCTKDFETAFSNVTSFCVLKGIWANSNNSTSLEQNLRWMRDSDYCDWIGVTCSPNSQDIIGLDIQFPNTPTTLLNNIGKLTSLQTLAISGDAKIPNGQIPQSIFKMGSLNSLRLESTLLSGPVPDTFDQMTSLKSLQLVRNVQLGTEMPKSIGKLSLTTLAISQQGLTGAIPDFLGQSETLQASLQNLDLSINQLTGNIPESLMKLKALKTLNLNTNLLSGDIPATLAQSKFQNTLTVLDLGANAFKNKIPDSISALNNLSSLLLEGNSLSGQIPASLAKLVKLNDLVLNDNQLTGNIPDGIGSLKIVRLVLTNNTMTGVIPTSVCQRQYTTCDLTLTGLTSPVKCAACKLATPPATTPPAATTPPVATTPPAATTPAA